MQHSLEVENSLEVETASRGNSSRRQHTTHTFTNTYTSYVPCVYLIHTRIVHWYYLPDIHTIGSHDDHETQKKTTLLKCCTQALASVRLQCDASVRQQRGRSGGKHQCQFYRCLSIDSISTAAGPLSCAVSHSPRPSPESQSPPAVRPPALQRSAKCVTEPPDTSITA